MTKAREEAERIADGLVGRIPQTNFDRQWLVRETEAALLSFRAEADWQPIATAPKDGTLVLLAGDDGDYQTVEEGYYIDDGQREGWWAANTHWTDATNGQIYPTHWMPKPPPPQEGQP